MARDAIEIPPRALPGLGIARTHHGPGVHATQVRGTTLADEIPIEIPSGPASVSMIQSPVARGGARAPVGAGSAQRALQEGRPNDRVNRPDGTPTSAWHRIKAPARNTLDQARGGSRQAGPRRLDAVADRDGQGTHQDRLPGGHA